MLKVLRDNLKYLSWILWVVIAIFVIFVFADFGGGIGPGGGGPVSYAAKVDGAEISDRRVPAHLSRARGPDARALRRALQRRRRPQMQLPMQALDRLVARRILVREAERLGCALPTPRCAARSSRSRPSSTPEGGFVGDQEYADILRRNGQTVAGFERVAARGPGGREAHLGDGAGGAGDRRRGRAQLPRGRGAGERPLHPAARRAASPSRSPPRRRRCAPTSTPTAQSSRCREQRVVDYLLVDALRLAATLQVPDAECAGYYDAHQEEFTRPEQVRARHILLKVDETRAAEAARARARGAQAAHRGRRGFRRARAAGLRGSRLQGRAAATWASSAAAR